MKEKWYALLAQLEIFDYENQLVTQEYLQNFEKEQGIILPGAYKDFCQIFGQGLFGDFVFIYNPDDGMLDNSSLLLHDLKDKLHSEPAEKFKKVMSVKSINRLLDRAFIFAEYRDYIAIWDLRSYKEIDDSYDIYWLSSTRFDDNIYYICRDFFEFVRDYCLGLKVYELLPESMWPLPYMLSHTFTPVSDDF